MQQAGYFLVLLKQEGNTFGVTGEFLSTVRAIDHRIEFAVRLKQGRRHGQRVVEISQRSARELLASVEHELGCTFYGLEFCIRNVPGPRVVVIDDILGVSEITF